MSGRRWIQEHDARGREGPDPAACICVLRIVLLLEFAFIKSYVSYEVTYVLWRWEAAPRVQQKAR